MQEFSQKQRMATGRYFGETVELLDYSALSTQNFTKTSQFYQNCQIRNFYNLKKSMGMDLQNIFKSFFDMKAL